MWYLAANVPKEGQLCEDDHRIGLEYPEKIRPSWRNWYGTDTRNSAWLVVPVMARRRTVVQALAKHLEIKPQSVWCVCRRDEQRGWRAVLDSPRSGRPYKFRPFVRAQIEQLACCEPNGIGLHLTHWSTRS